MKEIGKAITAVGLIAISVGGMYLKVEPAFLLGCICGVGVLVALSLTKDEK